MTAPEFWQRLDELVRTSTVVIDRPAGSRHLRYPEFTYPLDYGYLAATRAADGGGIDVWRGSLAAEDDVRVTAIVVNVDLVKRDTELKLLLNCTPDEACRILATHNVGRQSAILIARAT
jgi:inorganic pyrophosphatase